MSARATSTIPRGEGPALGADLQRTQAGRDGRTTDGMLGHLDAVYALAFLSSGDGEDAEQVVVDAFVALCGEPTDRFVCDTCAWRALADHVRLAGEGRGVSAAAATTRAPFRDGALSQDQREAIALTLGGREAREAAGLLGVSGARFERDLRRGLELLHPVMLTIPMRFACSLPHPATSGA